MAYVHYTEQQKDQARRTDIADLIHRTGGTLKRSGSEYEWMDGSQKVTIRGHLWFHQYEQKGGDAISFVQRFMDKSYPEAMEYLLGGSMGTLTISPPIEKKTQEPLEMPPRNDSMRRVYGYLLNHRGLDKSVVDFFVRGGMLYESADYHNAVFVGYDKSGKPKHATMRGTAGSTFRGNAPNCQPEFSFHFHGKSDTVYIFEAPIDMLSYISMNKNGWQQHSYAALCGVGDRVLYQMMQDSPHIKKVMVCLDNDIEGKKAIKRITERLSIKGIEHQVLVPNHKDWNEDLLYPEDDEPIEDQEEQPCQASQHL